MYKANPEKKRERFRAYYKANTEKLKSKSRRYQKENPEKTRAHNQVRRSRKVLLPTPLTIGQWEKIKILFNNSCAYCGKKGKLEQDHFVALVKGGEYSRDNIIPACKSCNSKKHTEDFFKWYPIQSFYTKGRESKILNHLGYKKQQQQQLSIF